MRTASFFARYHLLSRAVAELDRVLEVYPDEIEIHKRLVGLCWKDLPERAEQAAQALAVIYAQQGDTEGARRFAQMAGEPDAAAALAVRFTALRAPAKIPEPEPEPPTPTPAQTAPSPPGEGDLTSEFSPAPSQEDRQTSLDFYLPDSSAPASAFSETPVDPATLIPYTSALASYSEIQMVDLSQDLEAFLAAKAAEEAASESPQQAASFNFDDSRIEISFYLENGFFEEARGAVESLEETLRGDPRITELRALVNAYTAGGKFEPSPKAPPAAKERTPARVAPPGQQAVDRRAPVISPEAPRPEGQPAPAPSVLRGEGKPRLEPPPGARVESSTHLPGNFTQGSESVAARPAAPPLPAPLSSPPAPAEEQGEIPCAAPKDSIPVPGSEDDAEAHFSLGVAFWEMKLLDQAIREFQKAVDGPGKTLQPANYLQACSLLAACFMGKGMAPIAVKWYRRALETPYLDAGARLALLYDLGVAYERAGDLPRALEMFSEVYGQRIDFRDVAEKIRVLQQEAS